MVDEKLIAQAADTLAVEVVRALKQGGQKTVLLANSGDDPAVLKVISVGPSTPDALRRAQREVELLHRIDHPNVVRVASELVEIGDPCVGVAWLEDYLEGQDLAELLGEPWAWPDVRAMATDVASGLGALHNVKVVHRDLSANNIRRSPNGRYVVMDPGYARHHNRSELTIGGQPGTPGFLSPEHLQGYSGAPNAASDMFCVGNLMFFALTGRLPIDFTGDIADYARRLLAVEVPDVADFCPDLPEEAANVVRRCLHPQPARRYRNGSRLAEVLEALT